MGAEVRRGDLGDPDGLREAAAGADAVIHLAFDHETMFAGDFAGAVATDLAVVRAFGDALAGTGKTFIGIGLTRTGDAQRDAAINANPRSAVARAIAGFTERGVRTILVAIPPVTHSSQDKHGFIPMLIKIARDTGVSGYVGEGANRWPAAHTLDVAALYRLALEQGPGRSTAVRRGRGGHRGPRDRRDHRPPPGHPGREHPGRARPRTTSRASRSSRWTSPMPNARHQAAARLGAGPPRPHRRPRRRPLLHHRFIEATTDSCPGRQACIQRRDN